MIFVATKYPLQYICESQNKTQRKSFIVGTRERTLVYSVKTETRESHLV